VSDDADGVAAARAEISLAVKEEEKDIGDAGLEVE
jgi:hypothetical protein